MSATIAIDIFGEKSTLQSSQDSQIRAQIHSLRKKLEIYYYTEGKNEKLQVSIPKGGYKIELNENQNVAIRKKLKKTNKVLYVLIGLLVTSSIIIISKEVKLSKTKKYNQLPTIFKSICYDEKMTLLIGQRNYYSEYDKELGRFRLILDSDNTITNSRKKMSEFIINFPERKISIPYSSHVDAKSLKFAYQLKEYFSEKKETNVSLLNEIKDLKTNTIYLGDIRGTGTEIVNKYFNNSSFKLRTINNDGVIQIFLKDNKVKPTFYGWKDSKDRKSTSYVLFYKTKTIYDKNLLFIMPYSQMGEVYIFKELLNENFSTELNKELQTVTFPIEYEALIKVNGENGIGESHEIIYSKVFQ